MPARDIVAIAVVVLVGLIAIGAIGLILLTELRARRRAEQLRALAVSPARAPAEPNGSLYSVVEDGIEGELNREIRCRVRYAQEVERLRARLRASAHKSRSLAAEDSPGRDDELVALSYALDAEAEPTNEEES